MASKPNKCIFPTKITPQLVVHWVQKISLRFAVFTYKMSHIQEGLLLCKNEAVSKID